MARKWYKFVIVIERSINFVPLSLPTIVRINHGDISIRQVEEYSLSDMFEAKEFHDR